MANTVFDNKIIEAKAKDLLTTAVNTRSLMTVDTSLTEASGMTKTINTYTYSGSAEELANGVGNTAANRGSISYTGTDYTVKMVQQAFDYTDEDFMKDSTIVDNMLKGANQKMVNKMTADFLAALSTKNASQQELVNGVTFTKGGSLSYDVIVDAISELNQEDESKIFIIIPNKWKAALRKDSDYKSAQLGQVIYNGQVGTICGIPVIATKALTDKANAGTAIGTLTINEFECSWRGNPALEVGDKITLTTKDEKTVAAYLLNDTITFNGGLNQKTEWKYDAEEAETANPTTIGEKLKQTSARVDKQNQIIELQAETIDNLAKEQAQIRIETNKINSCVKQEDYIKDKSDLQGQINANKDSINESFTSLNDKLTEIEQTPEKIEAKVKNVIKENGAEKVVTQTGFTFDDTGLTVSKSNSELSTTITEDGMTVQRNGEVMLKASNTGVEAKNLNASTFLIIGNRSRFENYKSDFTGCFWIGG